ncbi:MAG TPA: ABC transporter permease [Rhodanobacteraceae bacterium]
MTTTASDATWMLARDTDIVLSGHWSRLVDARRRQALLAQWRQLPRPARTCAWDLRGVASLDSTGATLLWQAWERQLPDRVQLTDAQRHLFEWLAATPDLPLSTRHASRNLLEKLGDGIMQVLATAGGLFLLSGQLLLDAGFCVRHPRVTPWKEISAQIHHIGATALLLLGSIGFLIGAVMTIQMGLVLQDFGASGMVTGMMATADPRELGAVVVGLLMAGRTGSAMTASIGAMRITEEYAALQALGASPSRRLALPRVVAAAVSFPLLVVWTCCATAIGSALAAHAELAINYHLFLDQMVAQIQPVNVWIGLGKGVLFGVVIAIVGCYFGMSSAPDAESMSRHTTISVVTSLTAILLLDASLGAALTNVGLM